MWLYMAESRGVEPHPISENLVFKASRRTNPAALLSKGTHLMYLVYRLVKRTTLTALLFILRRLLQLLLRAWLAVQLSDELLLPTPSKCHGC